MTNPNGIRYYRVVERTRRALGLFVLGLVALVVAAQFSARGGSIMESRHDLSFLNNRGLGQDTGPMTGGTINDYRETCVYCHTPHNSGTTAPLWNRELPTASGYQMYSSPNFDSPLPSAPDGISLACLSCHDGTVAVDSIVNRPKYHEFLDVGTHYRMTIEGEEAADSCGKCHNRREGAFGGLGGAHDATVRFLQKELRDDHPFSMPFPSRDVDPQFNQPSIIKRDGGRAFPNGVQTYEGDKVQCASCHDIHNPDEQRLEDRDPFLRASNRNSALCLTCHAK